MTGALIDHLWQSTLFGAAVWSITLAMRNNGAAWRHTLWLVASLKFLVPFSALHALGAMAGLPAPVAAPPTSFTQLIDLTTPVLAPSAALVVTVSPGGIPWAWPAGICWAIGAAALAVRWWRGWRAAESMVRAARPVPGSPPDILVVDAAIEPSAARVFRPVVLLPVALLGRLSARQLDAVIAHEREHVARRDNLVFHLHALVTTLFWFHPMAWWIGRRLVEERERACDEAVLAAGHDGQTYAEGILAVCRHCHHVPLQVTASAVSGDLARRIRGIVVDATPSAPGLVKTMWLLAIAIGVAAAPLFAGAIEDSTRRHRQLAQDARVFRSARIVLMPVEANSRDEPRGGLLARPDEILVRNASLRELVALTYGVNTSQVAGGGDWLDSPRYDVRAELREGRVDPELFDPVALRGVVLELLAERFDLQVHVNRHCQQPCGRRALLAHSQ